MQDKAIVNKLFESFRKSLSKTTSINEIKAADAKEKFYKDIDNDIYQKIIKLDPTYNESNDEFGKYTKWVIKMWKGRLLKEEDFYKIEDYLDIYHTYRNRIEEKDIMRIKTPRELYDIIEPYKDKDQPVSKSDEVRKIKQDADKVYEDNTWQVIVPKSEEAACYYGKGTQWCTAANQSNNMFNFYNRSGKLFININKQTKEKFQFHFENSEFMDEQDNPISFEDMGVDETDSLFQFYKKEGYDTDKLIPSLDLLLGSGYIEDSERLINYLQTDMKAYDYTYDNLNTFIYAAEGQNYFWYDITYMVEEMLKDYKSEILFFDSTDFHNLITLAINDYDESSRDGSILEHIAKFIDLIVENESLTRVDLEKVSTLLTEKTTSADIDGFELLKMLKEETINKLEEESDFDYADDLKDAKLVSELTKMSEKKNPYVLLRILNTTYDDNNLKLNIYIRFIQSGNQYSGLVNVERFYNLLNNYDLFED